MCVCVCVCVLIYLIIVCLPALEFQLNESRHHYLFC